MGKKVYKMDRLMRSSDGKVLAFVTDYTVRTRWGKGAKKQVKGRRLIDFTNLPKTAEKIHLIFPKYRRGSKPQKSQKHWTREQVIKHFECW